MKGKDVVFSSILFCYFSDRGPSSIDLFFLNKITENPDLTAVRLMTKSTALIKGDSTQQLEHSIIDQLNGPDIYPVDTNYRMVWYNWLITNRFSNDPRIKQTGTVAGIYCIYPKKNEVIIRNTLEIIEKILRNISSELKTLDDIIKKKLKLPMSTVIKEVHYSDFIEKKASDVITKKISAILNKKVQDYSYKYSNKYVSQTEKFKIILQSMVFKKGTPDEIVDHSEKKIYWISMIKKLERIINDKMPNLMIKKIDDKKLRELYHLFFDERIWTKLPLNEIHPLIQARDVSDFFFYYWLAHHQLLKKKKVLKFYINLIDR